MNGWHHPRLTGKMPDGCVNPGTVKKQAFWTELLQPGAEKGWRGDCQSGSAGESGNSPPRMEIDTVDPTCRKYSEAGWVKQPLRDAEKILQTTIRTTDFCHGNIAMFPSRKKPNQSAQEKKYREENHARGQDGHFPLSSSFENYITILFAYTASSYRIFRSGFGQPKNTHVIVGILQLQDCKSNKI